MTQILTILDTIEKGVRIISFADPKKFEYFMLEIIDLRELLNQLDEENVDKVEIDKVLKRVTVLNMEYEKQKKHLEEIGKNEIKLGEHQLSTNEIRKQQRIRLYTDVITEYKKMPDINIERIIQIKKQWDSEKNSKLRYSAAEKDKIENLIAELLVEFYIKYIIKNQKMPENIEITSLTKINKFESKLIARLREAIDSEKDGLRRLQLQRIVEEGTTEEILNNEEVWYELTGIQVEPNIKLPNAEEVKQIVEKEEEEEKKELEQKNDTKIGKRKKIKCTGILRAFNGEKRLTEFDAIIDEEGGLIVPSKYKNSLYTITIPEETEGIARRCFYGFKNLQRIFIPAQIEYIGEEAFENSGIKDVDFEDNSSLKEIRKRAFKSTGIGVVKIPKHTKVIGEEAYANCEDLYDIIYEDDSELEEMRDKAFKDCYNLHNIATPKNLKRLGKQVFGISVKLDFFNKDRRFTTLTLNKGLIYIEDEAFLNRFINIIHVPNSVEIIGKYAFFCNPETLRFEEQSRIRSCLDAFGGYEERCLWEMYIPKTIENTSELLKKQWWNTVHYVSVYKEKKNSDNSGEGR